MPPSPFLRVALQMDPLARINPASDSTFLLGLGAQALGYTLDYYQPQDLLWQHGRLLAHASRVTLYAGGDKPFAAEPPRWIDLADAVDVVLLRQDPPFDMGYLTTTYLLDTLKDKVRVVNNPSGVRNASEKLIITHFPELIPPTLVSSDAAAIAAFAAEHGTVVAKRLYGNAGKDVFRFKAGDPQLQQFAANQAAAAREPIMLQAFLPEIIQGDKRIILFNGKAVGALRRVPATGNFLANLAQGATAMACDLSKRDHEICATLAPLLQQMGLYFVGIDVIGDYLIEVNTTSPTGLQTINTLYGLEGGARMEQLFWQGLV